MSVASSFIQRESREECGRRGKFSEVPPAVHELVAQSLLLWQSCKGFDGQFSNRRDRENLGIASETAQMPDWQPLQRLFREFP